MATKKCSEAGTTLAYKKHKTKRVSMKAATEAASILGGKHCNWHSRTPKKKTVKSKSRKKK